MPSRAKLGVSGRGMMRLRLLQHVSFEGAGAIADWAESAGHRLSIARVDRGAAAGEARPSARAQSSPRKGASAGRQRPAAARPPAAARAEPRDYAVLAGMSDEAVRAKTGCTWERWVRTLDRKKASSWPHREIAAYVHTTFGISGWWAQSVTVGYERIKGLREVGQRRSGSYEATKSKTVPVPIAALYRAFADPPTRERWLPSAKLTVRTSTEDRSMRIAWDDGSSLQLWFVAKGDGRSQVQVQHTRLASKADAEARKAYWAERLGALGELLRGRCR